MVEIDSVKKEDMPESLQEIADAIGIDNAVKLVKEYGGTRIFIPRFIKRQHKLVSLLGFEPADRLSKFFGGETLTVVRMASLIRRHRNQEIVKQYDQGVGVRSLAKAYMMTERQIYAILSTPDEIYHKSS